MNRKMRMMKRVARMTRRQHKARKPEQVAVVSEKPHVSRQVVALPIGFNLGAEMALILGAAALASRSRRK